MKQMRTTIFFFLFVFSIVAPAHSGSDDIKKNVEGSFDEKKLPQKQIAATKPNDDKTSILAYGISWGANRNDAKTHMLKSNFNLFCDRSSPIDALDMSNLYFNLTNNRFKSFGKEYFEASGNLTSKGLIRLKELQSYMGSHDIQSSFQWYFPKSIGGDIQKITYLWTDSPSALLLSCTVKVSSLNFALDFLKKYGNPKLKDYSFRNHYREMDHGTFYIYPLKGDVCLYISHIDKSSKTSINYLNLTRLKNWDLNFLKYIDIIKTNNALENAKGKKGS